MIGGGALSHWITKGLLLTKSYPEPFGLVQWNAEAKDHKSPETGTVDAVVDYFGFIDGASSVYRDAGRLPPKEPGSSRKRWTRRLRFRSNSSLEHL